MLSFLRILEGGIVLSFQFPLNPMTLYEVLLHPAFLPQPDSD